MFSPRVADVLNLAQFLLFETPVADAFCVSFTFVMKSLNHDRLVENQ